MPKVYIAAAFRSASVRTDAPESKAYGEIRDPKYIQHLEKIENVFLERGFITCLPHRDEGQWGRIYYEPQPIGALCLRHVATSDLVFAIAENGRGVHIEMGYAGRSDSTIILMAYKNGTEPSTLIWGLSDGDDWACITRRPTNIFTYHNDSDMIETLETQLTHLGFSPSVQYDNTERLVGVIDIGSHTMKFKIIRRRGDTGIESVRSDSESIGLMNDVSQAGEFRSDTIAATITLLSKWCALAQDSGAEETRIFGTAALRRASNTASLLTEVRSALGKDITVLDQDSEASFLLEATKRHFSGRIPVLILNLGGGSTQISRLDSATSGGLANLPWGTTAITAKWPWTGPMSDEVYHNLLQDVAKDVMELTADKEYRAPYLIHTGGELHFLLKCCVPMVISRVSATHPSEISLADFKLFADHFRRLHPQTVAAKYGLDPKWVAGSVASNVIALTVAERFGANTIIPSNLNVSDGIALSI